MKLPWNRGGLRTYLLLLALAFARPGSGAFWYGSALLLLGVALHVYAKGCLRQNQVVATGGPYRFVRHPFYAANLMIDESIALMSGCLPLMVLLPVWWLLVYVPVMRGEEEHLSRVFPEIYPPYQRRLPRLIPFRRPLPAEGQGFSWANPNIVSDTVIPRALRLSTYPLLFLVWRVLRARGLRPLAEGDGLLLSMLAILLLLHGLAMMLSRHLRDRAPILPDRLPSLVLRAVTTALVLVVAAMARWGEMESRLLLPLVGVLVLPASLALHLRSQPMRLAAEGMGLAGVAALCELPWLGALPVLVYAALMLDGRISHGSEDRGAQSPSAPPWQPSSMVHSLVLVSGVALAIAKELL